MFIIIILINPIPSLLSSSQSPQNPSIISIVTKTRSSVTNSARLLKNKQQPQTK